MITTKTELEYHTITTGIDPIWEQLTYLGSYDWTGFMLWIQITF